MIEVYKASHGVSKLNVVFKFGRSGFNLVCKSSESKVAKIKYLKINFINERVMLFWNKLPVDVKNSSCLNGFKNGLETFKDHTKSLGICDIVLSTNRDSKSEISQKT